MVINQILGTHANTEPMLLARMTSRKSSEDKSRSYRQCVETIQEGPKLKLVIDGNELSFLVTTLLARFQYG